MAATAKLTRLPRKSRRTPIHIMASCLRKYGRSFRFSIRSLRSVTEAWRRKARMVVMPCSVSVKLANTGARVTDSTRCRSTVASWEYLAVDRYTSNTGTSPISNTPCTHPNQRQHGNASSG